MFMLRTLWDLLMADRNRLKACQGDLAALRGEWPNPSVNTATMPWDEVFRLFLQPLPLGRGVEFDDEHYLIPNLSDWERFARWFPGQHRPYKADLWDCENYAYEATHYADLWRLTWPQSKGALPIGVISGWEPVNGSFHTWNILLAMENGQPQLFFLDFTPRWSWTGKLHKAGYLWGGKFSLVVL